MNERYKKAYVEVLERIALDILIFTNRFSIDGTFVTS